MLINHDCKKIVKLKSISGLINFVIGNEEAYNIIKHSTKKVLGMYTQMDKPKENKSRTVVDYVAQKKSDFKPSSGFVGNWSKGVLQLEKNCLENNRVKKKNIDRAKPIQRVLGTETNTLDGDELKSVMEYVNLLNNAVEKAYKLLTTLAFLHIKGDPYMEKFKDYWKRWETLKPEERGLMAARAGYWIESYATLLEVPAGKKDKLSWKYQVTNGNTRPDVVVSYEDAVVSYLDITSVGSEGHIYKKAGSLWTGNGYINEIMYPQIDFISMLREYKAGNIPDPDADIDLLSANYEKNKDEANARRAEFASAISSLVKPLLDTTESPTSNMKANGTGPRRNACIQAIRDYFQEEYTPAQVGQILSYAGLNRETYAVTTGDGSAISGAELLLSKKPLGG